MGGQEEKRQKLHDRKRTGRQNEEKRCKWRDYTARGRKGEKRLRAREERGREVGNGQER